MTDLENVAQVRVGDGRSVERLVCHPRLTLIAGLEAERPAVRVWGREAGELRELGSVGAESEAYDDAFGWNRHKRTPAVAWHPVQPLLMVANEDGTVRWTPTGVAGLTGVSGVAGIADPGGVPPTASYDRLAFSPDGRTLWATPSSDGGDDAWERSDVLDLASGTVSTGPRWDTGIAEHPGGGLVMTLSSDQGATHGLFARVDQETTPAAMRVLRRALILDADGYETPVFSSDGRHFAVRGNAYGNSLAVFAFPSLRRVLATALGEPSPGYPYPPEWLAQMRAWSSHNIAFGTRPGVLWVGTPTGALVEIDLEAQHAVEHDVPAGSRVSALAATATGELVVAGGGGELLLLAVRSGSAESTAAYGDTAASVVTAFLDATSEVPDDGDPEPHLVVTDGAREWEPDDLETVVTATGTDPTWLRLRAAINSADAAP
ncbi:hypothetical protein ACFU9Y_32110 [Streptomyces sp. NPDC057621]|uniref:hypothetical protein n=1 Tax=Streptomyces sp. NPDC057621 TaxID=3346186 RepID=UPI0036CB5BA6